MKTRNVFKYIGFGILGLGFVVAATFGVQALWNWLIPDLFNGPELSYWQTVGLFVLSKILLTGVAPGSKHHDNTRWKRKYQDRCREKYDQSPEMAGTTA